ncbi:hypothetical protein GSI_00286 [Ganoderma sinense ZZ0214-1]|uniref:Uncharacterized protein n=1 Tax=Ganoderma sinense ZZ0214-1 TaxID=1077348 RepID=A0A2G8SS51_9APHY|nr:hypothetical protein GSI_00286 [Ganoderma sinense ZZ0214-1]
MVPHVGPTRLLEFLSSNSHPEDSLATAALTISFILASVFDTSFRTVSITVLVLTLPSTRVIASLIFSAVRFVLLSVHSLVQDLCLVISSTSLFQAIAHYLVKATPILLLLILIILATWSTLSGFYPCEVAESTAPSTPRGPPRRSPMSFRRVRGIPVLKLPPDQTPTPCRERERRYLEIIDARDAKISRRAKRIEKLTLRLDQAREVVAARDATIAEKERTISENAAALAERERTIAEGTEAIAAKDTIVARLTEDVEHLRSDNVDAVSMLAKKSAHISDLCLQLATTSAVEERRKAAVDALHARVTALEADLSAAQTEAVALRAASSEKTVVPMEDTISAREASVVVQRDELIASLHAEILKLQREHDSLHCRIVEKEALLATQTATIDDLREEQDAAIRSAEAQTQLVEHLTPMVTTYEQEAANPSLAEHHLPPASSDGLETRTVTLDVDIRSLTQQLAAAQQEALEATRLQKAYEEVADAGAVRVIELVQQLEEQKELSEVDRELFLVRIRKLTVLLDKARSGIPVPDKAFAQLRLPANTRSARTEDIFTAVTPRLPAYTRSPSPSRSLQNERKLRRRSAVENLRQPLTDVTASATANPVPLGRQPVPRSRLPRPSSISIPVTVSQSPPAVSERRPDISAS